MNEKKLVSIVVPVFNEEQMIDEVYSRTSDVMAKLEKYEYEIVFFDDGSTDSTRTKIEQLCSKDNRVKAVFYNKNFGYSKNIYYCIQQAKGDCAIILHADLQNPPEIIPQFIEKWENGAKTVLGIKNESKENKFMYFMRTVFYWIMNFIFGLKLVPHATEFELFDKEFINILKQSKYPNPFLRGIITEYASEIDKVYYTQDKRHKGKTKFNISKYYDFAINGIVNSSKKLPRRMLIFGIICAIISVVEFLASFVPDLFTGALSDNATAFIIRLVFFALAIMIIFASIISEYIIASVDNSNSKPFVIEQKRINY